jgi:hypothetical protein
VTRFAAVATLCVLAAAGVSVTGAQDAMIARENGIEVKSFTNQFIDEINRRDQAAVVRQAKEYR